ncbi:uncharacterized protein LOC126767096 [Bactrocera neohumeralis]|uniref:uncharacterized protein LOC126767096 n=1 Tax=Bactrocera neohumeralis TaxID=98809 RepID=UPI0021657298|nr:uncharacterized protein LOC126767096 [Bactrocera neohumeralis]
MEDVLNSNAAANVYGKMDESGKWHALFGPKDRKLSPSALSNEEPITYDVYIDSLHCEPPGMQDLPKKERSAVWKGVTDQRKAATQKFTFPGEVKSTLRLWRSNGGASPHRLTLSSITDLKDVLLEWQQFVQGEHACKPRGPFLQRLRESRTTPLTGCMYRDRERLFFCRGPCVSAYTLESTVLSEVHGASADVIRKELSRMPGFNTVHATSFATLDNDLEQYFAGSGHVGGVVDFYPSWAQAAERRIGGKVFPISTEDDRFHVFFDDNIALGDEHSIVDVRDAKTGESVLGVAREEPFCVPVNAYRAITDENYFVEALAHCLELQCALPKK